MASTASISELTTKPVSPSSITTGTDPHDPAMMGVPAAIASIITRSGAPASRSEITNQRPLARYVVIRTVMFFAGESSSTAALSAANPAATAAFLATFLVFWLPPEARAGPRLRRSERCLLLCLTSALRFGSGVSKPSSFYFSSVDLALLPSGTSARRNWIPFLSSRR